MLNSQRTQRSYFQGIIHILKLLHNENLQIFIQRKEGFFQRLTVFAFCPTSLYKFVGQRFCIGADMLIA